MGINRVDSLAVDAWLVMELLVVVVVVVVVALCVCAAMFSTWWTVHG